MNNNFAVMKDAVQGNVLCQSDEGYAQARMVWNAMIDKKPAAIV